MDAKLVQDKIDALTKTFQDDLKVPLWGSPPLLAMTDIGRPVTNHDELKARMASLAALFDHFNKKDFDKIVGATTSGTRRSLVAFLKFTLPDHQIQIERSIESPLGYVCLLRDYLLHTKNKNYLKAFDFFGLLDPISDAGSAWSRVLFAFSESLDRLRELLEGRVRPRLDPETLNAEPLELIVEHILREKRDVLNAPKIAPLLREIVAGTSVSDVDLAETFRLDIDELRRMLFPLTDTIISVRPRDRRSTTLTVTPQFAGMVSSGALFADSSNHEN